MQKMNKKTKVILAAVGIILISIFTVLTIVFGINLNNGKVKSTQSHADRMDPTATDIEYPEGEYTEVKVGMYVEALRNVSIADSSFEGVFYIWFSWEGPKEFSPGSNFQVIGGQIEEKEVVSEHYNEGQNYQRYKVTASFDKYYDLSRVSLEDHMLNIYIEDTTRDGAKLRYVPDVEQTNISSRVKIPGFDILNGIQSTVKPHEYKSTYSSPNADGEDRVFSQYIVGIEIQRDGFGFYLKIAIPFILSVGLALFALYSHKTEADSLGLSGAAFFGVVANAYIAFSLVPANGGSFNLLDMLNIVSLLSVILVVILQIVSLNLRKDEENEVFCNKLDNVAFWSISIGYIAFNILIPLLAYKF